MLFDQTLSQIIQTRKQNLEISVESKFDYLQKLQIRMIFYCQLKLKNTKLPLKEIIENCVDKFCYISGGSPTLKNSKKTKAEFREFLQQEFSPPKYFSNPNLNLFPMTKYYTEFQTFLQTQISNLEQNNQIKLTIEQRKK